MQSKAWIPVAALIVVTLSGCLGGGGGGGLDTHDPGGTGAGQPGSGGGSTSTPGGTPGTGSSGGGTDSTVNVDPNATFIGGAHTHDWWGELTNYVIMDEAVDVGQPHTGLCVGAITLACQSGNNFVFFPPSPEDSSLPPNNIWPGTGKVTIDVAIDGVIAHPFNIGVSIPHRGGWTDNVLVVDELQESFGIEDLQENNTDPPHFRTSLWNFRLQPQSNGVYPMSAWQGEMRWTVTIHRADRPLPVDPPHPDYWGAETHKLLLEDTKEIIYRDLAVTGTYSNCCGTRLPENNTVTIGAGRLDVRLEWRNEDPVPTVFGLDYCAPGGPADCIYTAAQWYRAPVAEEGTDFRVFHIPVRPDQWDSPYDATSGWQFELVFDNENLGEYGSFTGEVDWRIEVWKAGHEP